MYAPAPAIAPGLQLANAPSATASAPAPADEEALHDGPSTPQFNLEEALRQRGAKLDVYENSMTHERKHGHPGASLILPVVRGMQVRAARALKPTATDGWVQFVDAMGQPYFYNFRDRKRTAEFPKLDRGDVARCVLPMRQLEPSAQMLCKVGEGLIPSSLSYTEAVKEARRIFHEPCKAARAVQLASNPCPLDEILMNAQYLGLGPVDHQEFMFLVDVMFAPELPCGWLARAAPGMAEGSEYYWNMMLGWAQWEHPQISLITGVVNDLKKRMREHEHDVDMRKSAHAATTASTTTNRHGSVRRMA